MKNYLIKKKHISKKLFLMKIVNYEEHLKNSVEFWKSKVRSTKISKKSRK